MSFLLSKLPALSLLMEKLDKEQLHQLVYLMFHGRVTPLYDDVVIHRLTDDSDFAKQYRVDLTLDYVVSPLLFGTKYSREVFNCWVINGAGFSEVSFNSLSLYHPEHSNDEHEISVFRFIAMAHDCSQRALDLKSEEVRRIISQRLQSFEVLEDAIVEYIKLIGMPPEILRNSQGFCLLLLTVATMYDPELMDVSRMRDARRREEMASRKSIDMGNAEFLKGNYHDALQLYTSAQKEGPHNYIVYMNRSQVYLNLGKYKEAERDAIRAVFLNPWRPKAVYRVIKACQGQGDIQRGLSYALMYMINFDIEVKCLLKHKILNKDELINKRIEMEAIRTVAKELEERWNAEFYIRSTARLDRNLSNPYLMEEEPHLTFNGKFSILLLIKDCLRCMGLSTSVPENTFFMP